MIARRKNERYFEGFIYLPRDRYRYKLFINSNRLFKDFKPYSDVYIIVNRFNNWINDIICKNKKLTMKEVMSFIWGFVIVFCGGLIIYIKFLNYIDNTYDEEEWE